ncbi:MAG: ATP-binding protein [Candidatus Methylopumilus sp.]|jgi:predicted AAA+ superfamily ATPase|nr:ATP-binding protein [Candidatus Methylopumilus sp.]
MADFESLIQKAESLIARLEAVLPPVATDIDWNALAWRWQVKQGRGYLRAVDHPHHIVLDAICNVDEQKSEIVRNTAQFVNGFPANNVLLTGARGTGKSTLVKALLSEFSKDGLRLVEVEKEDLVDLPEIVEILRNRPECFIVFCDDLSFEATEPGYKSLKVVLDGSISSTSDNVVVYATSNRRHLMPEFMAENLQTQYVGEEIRPGDTTEEKVSLSERFGLWLSFYAFDQDEYLKVAQYWLMHFGSSEMTAEIRQAALLFSLTRGARSGRVAYQFARDYVGRSALKDASK